MEKELLRQAFNAGVEYQKQFECKLAESYDKPNFDEWYDTVVLPQSNVIKSVCDICDSTTDKPSYKLCDKHYAEYLNFKQTVLNSVCDHKDTYIVSGVFGGKWCEKCKEMVDKQTDN